MKMPRWRHDIKGSTCQVWDDALLLARRCHYSNIFADR